ncbi:sericin 1-like [Panicum miliaceum]|uniref:Sericin 1-like n=1 Tax=Panicum miliaceum TaxID=4540 RepID=A0A3L6Q600_PANMI|nr:sericin 1-like [Panicum miliaceum]
MSDDGDHTCPLCAEEMDITDQQLKPCKCGYDVLERMEYFGQYGKVLEVSVSGPTGPPSQQASANDNISVYASLNLMLYMHDLFLLHIQRHYLGFVNQFDISNSYPPLYAIAWFKFVCFGVILEH